MHEKHRTIIIVYLNFIIEMYKYFKLGPLNVTLATRLVLRYFPTYNSSLKMQDIKVRGAKATDYEPL